MKLSQLRNLIAVIDAGGVRQAARNLNVSQSAVTKSIKQLEDDLGIELLHRSAAGVAPTAAGEALLARARVIEAELRQARNDIESVRGGKSGEIWISASPTVMRSLLPRAVLSFRRRRPQVRFHIEEGVYPDVLPALRLGELDFAVCLVAERLQDEALACEILVKDRLTPTVRRDHPLAREGALKLADLVDREWIVYRRTQTGRDVFEQTFVQNGLEPPRKTIECTSFACILSMVESSDLITLLPARLFNEMPRPGALTPLLMDAQMPPWNLAVIYRSMHSLSPLCEAFLQELRRTAAQANRSAPRAKRGTGRGVH